MPRLSPKIVLCNSFLYTNNIQKHYSVSRCVISIIIVIAPTDYLDNAWMSVSGALILVHAYFLTSPSITKRALEGLEDYHNLLRWPSIIFRLCNDLVTSTVCSFFFGIESKF